MIRTAKYVLILLSIFICQLTTFAQSAQIDSLRAILKSQAATSSKNNQSDLQRKLAYTAVDKISTMQHSASAIDSCMQAHEVVVNIMMQLNDSAGLAYIYCEMGEHYYFYHGNGALAHTSYLKGKSFCPDLESLEGQKVLSSLVLIYKRIGNFPRATEYNLLLVDIFEKTNNKKGLSVSYRHLAELFNEQSRYDLALDYALKAYNISTELPDNYQQSNPFCYTIFSLARAYMAKNDFINAHKKADEGIRISKEIDDKWAETDAWDVKGQVFKKEGKYANAIDCYKNAIIAKRSVNDTMPGLVYVYGNMSDAYHEMHEYKKAIHYGERAIEMARMLQDIGQIHSMSGILSKCFEHEKDFKAAYYYSVQFTNLSDSLFSVEKISAMEAVRLEVDFEKKEAMLNEQQEKERIIREEKERKQKIITGSVIGGLAIVALFAGVVFRSLRITRRQKLIIENKNIETEKQKDIIEAKNKDITDSITYAKRIQQAKLPDKKDIYKALQNAFVLFKPKDIVSGDFYYFHKKEKLIFIASADCTGHGVPGAFMSIIGSEQLKDAVSQSSEPSEILKLLNKGIKASLRQSDSDESTRDGMDIALCSIDIENRVVKYAGANRPIWIIRKGQLVLEEIKATKKAIGGLTEDLQEFNAHELKLNQGDTFYLSTDGYADTFNGLNSKKLTTKKFKQVLLGIQHKTMQEQEQHLEDFIEHWKAGTEQVDDILVIGVRL